MNSQGFSFPPPPPPPPSQQQPQPQQQYPSQQHQHQHHPNPAFASQYGAQPYYGQRGGRAPGAHHRGRGRGYGNRGAGRGGHFRTPDANRAYPTAAPSGVGYNQMNYSGYAAQPMSATPQTIPTAPITPSTASNFQHPTNAASFTASQPFTQASAPHGPPYQTQQNYGRTYAPSTAQPTPTYPSVMPTHQPLNPPAQPPMMGPPMRWGFEQQGPTGTFTGPQRGHQRNGRPFNGYGAQSPTGERPPNHANKRDHNSAFGKHQSVALRIPAPPPVPSFGNPLPSKPPPPVDAARKPKKKKRKHNQLGLTPKTEDHESSDEEDDVDEESRLASGNAGASAPLQITYRGRTATLKSPEEIAAWIEERKKRYPTQARVEEKKKVMEEAKKARQEVQRQREQRRQEMKKVQKDARNRKDSDKQAAKEQSQKPTDPIDAAAKAKEKADKLRRKLMREEKRVAKAEADAERARMKVEELQKGSADVHGESGQPASADAGLPASETTNSNTTPATHIRANPETSEEAQDHDGAGALPSDASDSSDWTSSSGSESSSDESESDDDSAPEEATSRREGPERVPPPARENKRQVCRHFARTGRCMRGSKCKFLHEGPERGAKPKPAEQKGRKGLLQALLDRQKEEEDRNVMEAIVWLGENGLLDEGARNPGEASDKPSGSNGANATQQQEQPEQQDEPQDVLGGTMPGQEADTAPITA
ncbi:hypothetical protein BO71DRAFT_368839 [Aspergillus ellipticus CBS 707.79]|uniref:C3H1-type domain-containing protein n=1 Tax=Aspergillus ellipticus CBS 707.79 TaxID=1448320 RepID=A0A319DPK9_9EURO|nr:hypothetical protein BO71DRAFT_368839 [Aspergillus ellipticus CBS 707.79]